MSTESREFFLNAARRLVEAGAGGVVLGCTELPLIMGQRDFDVPIFDTAEIPCQAAVAFAFGDAF